MDGKLPAEKKAPRKPKTTSVKATRAAASTAATPVHAEDTRTAAAQAEGSTRKAAARTRVAVKSPVRGTSQPPPLTIRRLLRLWNEW